MIPPSDKIESGYWARYMERFDGVLTPTAILEIGVLNGASLDLWHEWSPDAKIFGVDLEPVSDEGKPWTTFKGNQYDSGRMVQIAGDYGPFDIIVDDAEHTAAASRAAFGALWPYVTPGGCYVVEDWGTGYWNGWADGGEPNLTGPAGHTLGMVGFVKSLVDRIKDNGYPAGSIGIKSIEFCPGQVFIWKRAS